MKDEANVPLVGALMSVSDGERQYRSNNLTNSDGQLLLLNLGPGEYFIKPLKKEFTFSPANKVLPSLKPIYFLLIFFLFLYSIAVKCEQVFFDCFP